MANIPRTTGRVKAPNQPRAVLAREGGAADFAQAPAAVGRRKAQKVQAAVPSRRAAKGGAEAGALSYVRAQGVDTFVHRVAAATPMEIVEVERRGVDSMFLKDLSRHMQLPAVRIFDIVGVPKATAEKKVAANEPIAGVGGQAALGLARLLAIAQGMVENSTAPEAQGFDAARWLGQWIERPQAALGGRKPADLICTPTGLEMVARLLGAIESGAYQ